MRIIRPQELFQPSNVWSQRMAVDPKSKTTKEMESSEKSESASRQISGNLPYTTSVGVFKRALQKIIESERPAKFNKDFLNTVFEISGGASMPVIPILKKAGLLAENGSPTSIYADFQTDSGRPNAALQAMRNGFPEIFKRNQYAHKAERDKIIDLIVAITGLTKTDRIVGYIYNTFQAFQEYAKDATDTAEPRRDRSEKDAVDEPSDSDNRSNLKLGLAYQINIVLPESTNIDVFNSIFRSLRENSLDEFA
jgi:hypothetical protein